MITRRNFLVGGATLLGAASASRALESEREITVNDIHSQLNETHVTAIAKPTSVRELQGVVRKARAEHMQLSVAGGRHAMGGQQFGAGTTLVDIRSMNRILGLDKKTGMIEVEAGVEWPQLISEYMKLQANDARPWGIAQKQTGADRLTMAGTMAANAHGRGLHMKPFISNVESFEMVDASGEVRHCSRTENRELFGLVIGGYGLFGLVTSLRLQLVPRQKVQRVVEIRSSDDLMARFDKRIADGFLYGDFQFGIERDSDDFLHRGVFSCYKPVPMDTAVPETQKELSGDDWRELLYFAHQNPKRAFDLYCAHYLATNGQIYWSDTHQFSIYSDNYHRELDQAMHAPQPATEIITEINVPRSELKSFFDEAREDFRKNKVDLIYGTVRLIERDNESFLPWAKEPYACTIFNIHTVHTPAGIQHAADTFRRLIDMAARRGGTYYLTYHRYATRKQVESCYPQFAEFLRLKKRYDPDERFQSEWYRHYRSLFADVA